MILFVDADAVLFRINTYEIVSRGWQFGMACCGMMLLCNRNIYLMLCKKNNTEYTGKSSEEDFLTFSEFDPWVNLLDSCWPAW